MDRARKGRYGRQRFVHTGRRWILARDKFLDWDEAAFLAAPPPYWLEHWTPPSEPLAQPPQETP